jgi:hypothetical protein
MPEYIKFLFFFGFLIFWNYLAYKGVVDPEKLLNTKLGKFTWRKSPPKQVRIGSTVFLIFGILFFIFAIWQLSTGNFKWNGNPKLYHFIDFIK